MSTVTLEPSWDFKGYQDSDHIRVMVVDIHSNFGEVYLPVSLIPELVTALGQLVERMNDTGTREAARHSWDQACELEHAAREQRKVVRAAHIVLSVEGT